ncbi:hypothetical protein BB560_002727, partial [Smittium megazygosporum]
MEKSTLKKKDQVLLETGNISNSSKDNPRKQLWRRNDILNDDDLEKAQSEFLQSPAHKNPAASIINKSDDHKNSSNSQTLSSNLQGSNASDSKLPEKKGFGKFHSNVDSLEDEIAPAAQLILSAPPEIKTVSTKSTKPDQVNSSKPKKHYPLNKPFSNSTETTIENSDLRKPEIEKSIQSEPKNSVKIQQEHSLPQTRVEESEEHNQNEVEVNSENFSLKPKKK